MRINGIGVVPVFKKIADVSFSECSACHKIVIMELMESSRKFTMYWIPVKKWNKRYCIICPACNFTVEVSAEKAKEIETNTKNLCSNCRTPIIKNSKFCAKCGNKHKK